MKRRADLWQKQKDPRVEQLRSLHFDRTWNTHLLDTHTRNGLFICPQMVLSGVIAEQIKRNSQTAQSFRFDPAHSSTTDYAFDW